MAEDAGATVYARGLNLGGTAVSATAAELNIMDGVTATAAELNLLDGATSLASSINGLSDGLVEDNSVYVGSVPSSTDLAQYNVGLGKMCFQA